MTQLLSSSCRVAFAALIHDLGKFAERAKLPFSQDQLNSHKTLYCPFNLEGKYHSHVHAAYTGYALDQIEDFLPDLIKTDSYPFASRPNNADSGITDSMINAAAAHHKPDTFLQWIIATADRVASGFEREAFDQYNQTEDPKNHYQARLLTLLESISLDAQHKNADHFAYPLRALTANSIFPQKRNEIEPNSNNKAQEEYSKLWQQFAQALKLIPDSHKSQWDLWLDHFDTAYQCFTTAIPSSTFKTRANVSLYDHSKTTAALATALWRWHEEKQLTDTTQADKLRHRKDWQDEKFLLIQGDFFGIQDFIFSGGSDTNKQAAKLLRGRSFQVSLFTELAALKILQACELPSTSQIMNVAGKFLIVAPNTEKIKMAVEQVKTELNQWFITHTYGLVGVGLATLPASCNDFIGGNFKALVDKLFKQLESIKLQRFDLTDSTESVQNIGYPHGVCRLNHYFPAETEYNESSKNSGLSAISRDQITIGEQLVKKNRILICSKDAEIFKTGKTECLSLPIFGYNIIFTENEAETGKFRELVILQQLYRVWDFSIPKTLNEAVWHGYARRYINGYIPEFKEDDHYASYGDKYKNIEETPEIGEIKTFDFIASEDRIFDEKAQQFIGQTALMTLKGDVDNLGSIFQKGLEIPTFAKMAALSRQMNQFFSLWLPAICAEKFPNMYTVFAGGDDFFLIGPWKETQKLAFAMQQRFADYVAQNKGIHFSAGMVMTKLEMPVPQLGELAEEALEKAKGVSGKNAVTIYQQSVPWANWANLTELENEIERLAKDYDISRAYLYSLMQFADLAADKDHIESTMWRSRFYYKTSRYVVDKLEKKERQKALEEISTSLGKIGIETHKSAFKIPLFNYFYQIRK
ncbi:type III-A CRISPR-associated protein Cas10/Csm1 [Mannheimia massilioguelmaensis]|uniref:type III-A CRISPR-associated protein Cas10/Csm1 n=1 Tax=Mannheimia massilioguelmaensis TaxID=1604354 RepID=UPI0005C91B61|nr:type III-A CRISPR-associated protein Cas10/Csm1 [Mannheimia massilioguelmaensis]